MASTARRRGLTTGKEDQAVAAHTPPSSPPACLHFISAPLDLNSSFLLLPIFISFPTTSPLLSSLLLSSPLPSSAPLFSSLLSSSLLCSPFSFLPPLLCSPLLPLFSSSPHLSVVLCWTRRSETRNKQETAKLLLCDVNRFYLFLRFRRPAPFKDRKSVV